MSKRTYTQVLEAILDRLDAQEESRDTVRAHGKVLAAHCQWIESHERREEIQDTRIDRVDRKSTIAGAIGTAFAGLGAIFVSLKR